MFLLLYGENLSRGCSICFAVSVPSTKLLWHLSDRYVLIEWNYQFPLRNLFEGCQYLMKTYAQFVRRLQIPSDTL
jgi:hypothetical protein